MYAKGEGVAKDYVVAYHWANLAATEGSDDAHVLKVALKKVLTREQINKAQSLSREWTAKKLELKRIQNKG